MKKGPLKVGQWLYFDPLYRVNHALVICKPDQFFTRVGKILPKAICQGLRRFLNDEPPHSLGCCIQQWYEHRQLVLIWLDVDCDVSVLAHEALHAACYVLKNKGIKMGDKSEEAYTYYMEWVMDQGLRRCRPRKRTR